MINFKTAIEVLDVDFHQKDKEIIVLVTNEREILLYLFKVLQQRDKKVSLNLLNNLELHSNFIKILFREKRQEDSKIFKDIKVFLNKKVDYI